MVSEKTVLFWLEAANGNQAALEIINDPSNKSLKINRDGNEALEIQLNTYPKVPGRVVSFGRDPGQNDVILSNSAFSRNQCHFYFHESSHLLLRDTSSSRKTQIFYARSEDNEFLRLRGSPRQRVIFPEDNMKLVLQMAEFLIIWNNIHEEYENQLLHHATMKFAQRTIAPELALTEGGREDKFEHRWLMLLREGTFGTVHKTVNLVTGDVFAVKTSKDGGRSLEAKRYMKREVDRLARLSHDHIINYVHSQGWNVGKKVEIFTTLHQGNLTELIPTHRCGDRSIVKADFLPGLIDQICDAMDFIHQKGIMHRDMKVGSILYDHSSQGSWTFYLSDFGLSWGQGEYSNFIHEGASMYMAPEVTESGQFKPKSDIWSFGVMILVTMGYICEEDFECSNGEWENRMAVLQGYLPTVLHLTHNENLEHEDIQRRWYGRMNSLIHDCEVSQHLVPLLNQNAGQRPTAKECLLQHLPRLLLEDFGNKRNA